jgi:hypothetical protein
MENAIKITFLNLAFTRSNFKPNVHVFIPTLAPSTRRKSVIYNQFFKLKNVICDFLITNDNFSLKLDYFNQWF